MTTPQHTGAIVAYFILTFVLPTIFGLVATGQQWANIAVTGIAWLLIPLAVGLGFVMRAEVK